MPPFSFFGRQRLLWGLMLLLSLAQPSALWAAPRGALIDAILAQLREHYIDTAQLPAIERLLRARQAAGDYDRLDDGAALAKALTQDLQSIGHSGHLNLRYRANALALQTGAPEAVERAAQIQEERQVNYGITRAEVLSGNVGYLRVDRFGEPEAGGRAVAGAMMMLADTDALILDLRANRGGGVLNTVLASYFLPAEPQHLSTLEYPRHAESIQVWSLPALAGPRYLGKPVYVLTSGQTFSAGEALAYNLQAAGRVKVVGQATRGGADPNMVVPVDPHFSLSIPIGRTVHPQTHTSWEGVGVQPDVPVDSTQDALHTALALAERERRPATTAASTLP